ncbi:TPA: type II toxin-antitoxin system VapC family toxin [archaeon]|nr:type II toxin-antitoxin system VapC family toxin [Candidatus Naiadarchaeales archaeon SRR2090159.bin1288]
MTQTAVFDTYTWVELFEGRISEGSVFNEKEIVTSVISLYEMYSKYLQYDEQKTKDAVGLVQSKARIVNVDKYIALRAAQLRKKYKFSMADSIILSTAIQENAEIVTGDPHFKNVTEVKIRFL